MIVVSLMLVACSSQSPASTTPPASTQTAAITTTPAATTPTTTAPTAPTTTIPATTAPTATTPATKSPTTTVPTSPLANQQRGGILRWVEQAGPGTPIGTEWLGYNYNAGEWALDVLLRSLPDGTMTVDDSLSASYKIDATGNPPSMTFNLRKGVKFIDGTEVNAQAVKWNMEMIKQGGLYKSTTDYWVSFEVIDDYTLKCNFTMWRNTMLRAWENYYVVSPTAYTQNGVDWMKFHMVGSGSFKQVDYQQDVRTTYTRNENFWQQGKPYLDGVQMLYVADPTTQEALMKSGGAEALTATPKIGGDFMNDPAFKVVTKDQGPMCLVPDSLNAESPYANLKVRQALQYAVDREGLAKAFGYGSAKPAYQVGSPTSMAYVSTLPQIKQDVAKAKQLLADAGYPSGFKTTVYVNPLLDRNAAVAVQAQLAAIGITADLQFPLAAKWNDLIIKPVSPPNALFYTQMLEMANYNTYMNVYWADPGTFQYLSTKKPDGWKDLFARSLTAPSPDKAIFQQIGTAFYNDATVVPLYYGSVVYILSSRVHDSGLFTWGWDALWSRNEVWLSK